ncbi:MAG: endonuclease/exonuclease/phosphatase family protein [Lautropia sp.]
MKLVSWNVQWCRGCDGRVDPARIVADARALADFDVLCLQEVADGFDDLDGSSGGDQFAELAALLPGFAAIAGPAVDLPRAGGGRRRFGNLLLSRLPVGRVLRHQLPWPEAGAKAGMPRLLIEATLTTPLGPIRVMTTHLEYYSAANRAAQVEAVRTAHAAASRRARAAAAGEGPGAAGRQPAAEGPFAASPDTTATILTADFNYRPDSAEHQRMQASFADDSPRLCDAWTALHPDRPHPPTLGVHDREQWPSAYPCDFIYLSEDLLPRAARIVVDGQSRSSDHQPVLIELGI